MFFPLLALVFGVALLKTKRCWAPGTGPFDAKPEGVGDRAATVNDVVSPSSKRAYRVTTFQRGEHQGFHVAVRTSGSKDWVSFLVDDATKARVLYRANSATRAGIDALRKDFAL